jgi:Cu-Zn family superoxide dismutase
MFGVIGGVALTAGGIYALSCPKTREKLPEFMKSIKIPGCGSCGGCGGCGSCGGGGCGAKCGAKCGSNCCNKPRHAVCLLIDHDRSGVKGMVELKQEKSCSPVKITVHVNGLKPGKHGFHIHEYGDLSDGCTTAGAHYNPFNKTHGGPSDEERHVGDLGNVVANDNGTAFVEFEDKNISLYGNLSVIGRSFVIHANEDDLGKGGFEDSKTTGHAGSRLACGVIALAKCECNHDEKGHSHGDQGKGHDHDHHHDHGKDHDDHHHHGQGDKGHSHSHKK